MRTTAAGARRSGGGAGTLTRLEDVRRHSRLARRLDRVACRLARGRPALDAALGEVLARLGEGRRLVDLHFAKRSDFAREKLGIPPRTFYALLELGEGLRERPLLRRAVLAGRVTALKARIVMELARGEREAAFTVAAMETSASGLRRMVSSFGGVAGEEAVPFVETLRYRMTPEQQDRLDAGLGLAKERLGHDAPGYRLYEELAREWLAFRRGREPGEGEGAEEVAGAREPTEEETRRLERWLEEMEGRRDEVSRQLRVIEEAFAFASRPEEARGDEDAAGLLALAQRLLARRSRFDEPLGRVLARMERQELWWWVGYGSLGEYCRERLGMSGSTARQRIRLERRLSELPSLREALRSGRLTYTKAQIVARQATRRDVEDRIAAAARTSCEQVRRHAEEEEAREDRSRGVRKVRGSRAALLAVEEAVRSARRYYLARGESIGEGEALARIGERYVCRWEVPLRGERWRTRWKREALVRYGGLCAVPGCTRAAKHLHHIEYRRDGGADTPENVIGVCGCHHLLCIHRGRLTVRGRAGELLVWELKDRDLETYETWETGPAGEARRVFPA